MPLFSLTDIKFKEPKELPAESRLFRNTGNMYESNTYRYPLELGQPEYGHYMVIHINEQVRTQLRSGTSTDLPSILQSGGNAGGISSVAAGANSLLEFYQKNYAGKGISISSEVFSKAYKEAFSSEGAGANGEVILKSLQQVGEGASMAGSVAIQYLKQLASGSGLRTIRRTTDTVALYMPDTLNFTHQQNYSSIELGGGKFALLGAASDLAGSMMNNGKFDFETLGKNVSPFIASMIAGRTGNAGLSIFAAATGTVQNPQMEMIYTSPSFRSFAFDFMFYPRSSKEAESVQNIIDRLYFHQAPEVLRQGAGALGGYFLLPPSEFDIKFYYNGLENPNIPKISTCVLSAIDVDYAPNGFSAYETDRREPQRGGTGMPVGIKLRLQFTETEIMTKRHFNFESSGE